MVQPCLVRVIFLFATPGRSQPYHPYVTYLNFFPNPIKPLAFPVSGAPRRLRPAEIFFLFFVHSTLTAPRKSGFFGDWSMNVHALPLRFWAEAHLSYDQ